MEVGITFTMRFFVSAITSDPQGVEVMEVM
jgi:hypothetical protein